jgi:hypothetical protein
VRCRYLYANSLTGTVPTELGTLTALTYLCVLHSHPPRMYVCTVTGLRAERGGDVGVQGSIRQRSHGHTACRARHADCAGMVVRAPPSPAARLYAGCGLSAAATGMQDSLQQQSRGHTAHRAGHDDCADPPVRALPSPTAPGRVRRYRVVS